MSSRSSIVESMNSDVTLKESCRDEGELCFWKENGLVIKEERFHSSQINACSKQSKEFRAQKDFHQGGNVTTGKIFLHNQRHKIFLVRFQKCHAGQEIFA